MQRFPRTRNFLFLLCLIGCYNAVAHSFFRSPLTINYSTFNSVEAERLYLHTDKTHYDAGETVWFTGYKLSEQDTFNAVLFVSIHSLAQDSIISKAKFILRKGVASGSLELPHELKGGAYRLIAYTNERIDNLNLIPFQQLLYIKANEAVGYNLQKESVSDAPDSEENYLLQLRIQEPQRAGSLKEGLNVEYSVLTDEKQIMQSNTQLLSEQLLQIAIAKKYDTCRLKIVIRFKAEKQREELVTHLQIRSPFDKLVSPPLGTIDTNTPETLSQVIIEPQVVLSLTKSSYGHREKVTVHVRVQDAKGKAVAAKFSAAAVMHWRFDSNRICNFPLYNRIGVRAPFQALLLSELDWRRSEENGLSYGKKEATTERTAGQSGITVTADYYNKPYKQSLTYMIASQGGESHTVTTDKNGKAFVPYRMLYTAYGKLVNVMPMIEKKRFNTTALSLNIDQPNLDRIDRDVPIQQMPRVVVSKVDTVLNNKAGSSHLLTETVITGKPKGSGYNIKQWELGLSLPPMNLRDFGRVATVTKVGNVYYLVGIKEDPRNAPDISYNTGNFLKSIPGVWQSKVFTLPTPDAFDAQTAVATTLFWSHQIETDADGLAVFSFYTNDLAESVIVHIQGISDQGPLHAKTQFNVAE